MKNIAVDGYFMVGNRTGMGTVVFKTLSHYKTDNSFRINVYVPAPLTDKERAGLENKGIRVKVLRSTNFFCWEQILLPMALKTDAIDILWAPYNTSGLLLPCKVVMSVNDVIFMQQKINDIPTLYKKVGMLYRRFISPKAAKRAFKVIAISEFSKTEIMSFFKLPEYKIQVIHCGVDLFQNELSSIDWMSFKSKHGIYRKFILGFSSLEKRKNSMGLIKAFESLDAQILKDYVLVLFGHKNWKDSDEWKYILQNGYDNIIMLGYVSEDEKVSLYKNADVFVFPSLSEGFGMPVLEAFILGTPVVTSNTTSLPEVAGKAAVLVCPINDQEITNSITMVIQNNELRKTLINEGFKQCKRFNWNEASEKLKSVFASC